MRSGEPWTVQRFADEHGVSTTFLYQVLEGTATSARLEHALAVFVRENLADLQTRISNALAA